MATNLVLHARVHNPANHAHPYAAAYERVSTPASKVGLILVDLWDGHWCSSMTQRGDILAKQVAHVVNALRGVGGTIIHAPSDVVPAKYARHPARLNFLDGKAPATDREGREGLNGFPWPLCQDGCEGGAGGTGWTQQNERIRIDPRDIIVEEGPDHHESKMLLDYLGAKGIEHLVYAGAATNECVLWTRSTSIHTMQTRATRRNQKLRFYLARDLTDTMYLPPTKGRPLPKAVDGCNDGDPWHWEAAPPWEVHDSGTAATVAWIERNLGVPSILSSDLVEPET